MNTKGVIINPKIIIIKVIRLHQYKLLDTGS